MTEQQDLQRALQQSQKIEAIGRLQAGSLMISTICCR